MSHTVNISGDLVIEQCEEIWEKYYNKLEKDTDNIFDLSEVDKVDSVGVVLLLGITRKAHANNVDLKFINSPSTLLRLVKTYDLEQLLRITGATQPKTAAT